MKYRKIEIFESDLLDNPLSNYEIARRVGCNHSYISMLRSGKRIASYELYLKLRTALLPTIEEGY
jgi:transcriptional regulator with XRE-family HTH domain